MTCLPAKSRYEGLGRRLFTLMSLISAILKKRLLDLQGARSRFGAIPYFHNHHWSQFFLRCAPFLFAAKGGFYRYLLFVRFDGAPPFAVEGFACHLGQQLVVLVFLKLAKLITCIQLIVQRQTLVTLRCFPCHYMGLGRSSVTLELDNSCCSKLR